MMRVILSASIALTAVMGVAGAGTPLGATVSGTVVGVSPELGPTGCALSLSLDATAVGTVGGGVASFVQGGPGCTTPERAAIALDCVSIPHQSETVLEASGESDTKQRFVIRILEGDGDGQYVVTIRRFQLGNSDGACGTRSDPTSMSGMLGRVFF